LDHEKKNLLPKQGKEYLSLAFIKKKEKFLKRQDQISWLSWNFADHKNSKYLSTNN